MFLGRKLSLIDKNFGRFAAANDVLICRAEKTKESY